MLKNYFKIAFRNLWKHRVFSFINITGLAVGMTACFFIFLYVNFELSYDAFHQKADRIYRLTTDVKTPTETILNATTNYPNAPNIKNDFPEVESFVRVADLDLLVTRGELKFREENILAADSTFFRVFDFRLLKGNPHTVLKEPFNIVLTQAAAKKYFGNQAPLGQPLSLPFNDTVFTATVSGVMQDMPENSQIKGDMLISMTTLTQTLDKQNVENWTSHYPASYLLLKPGTDAKALEAKLPAYLKKHIGELMERNQMFYTLLLHPLEDVYLHFGERAHAGETGSVRNVRIFSVIALLILLIACFNFINLTTARAAERGKEVGIRKVVGAVKKQLALQYMGESVLLCLIAFVLAVMLSALLMPAFNHLAGKTIAANLFASGGTILILFLAAIGIGLLAGFYPAWVLSSFKPVTVLKGRFSTGTKGIFLRKGLVVAQFTISLALIAATIIVYKQMRYMRSQDLGFQKDQVMVVDTYGARGQDVFKRAIADLPGVQSTALSSSVPGAWHTSAYSEVENKQGDLQIANLDLYFVDFDYIDLYQIKMAAGRPFSKSFATDSTQAMILNEAATKMLGYSSPEQAIGKRFKQWGREGQIIGVMKDFHYHSLQEKIQPLTMRIEPGNWASASIKLSMSDLPATVAAIKNKWETIIPDKPFDYSFLDESFNSQYRNEERFGNLFFHFAALAIFISCLGLLGLVSYSTLQRTKEIGIRKVMGASAASIVTLLSKDFIKLVGIAILMAVPIVWYAMNKWLEGFAYRTNIAWWIFALAGLLALVVALFTVSFQSIKAALMNPVKSLRSE